MLDAQTDERNGCQIPMLVHCTPSSFPIFIRNDLEIDALVLQFQFLSEVVPVVLHCLLSYLKDVGNVTGEYRLQLLTNRVSRLYAIIEMVRSSNKSGNEYSISCGVILSPVVTSTERGTRKGG